MWRVIWKGIPLNADTPSRARAEAVARKYNVKLPDVIWTESGWVKDIGQNRRRGLRRNESTNKYEMRFTPRSTGIFVWMTDKFMSGWGQARGKINKLIIRCDTLEQAECIFKNAQMRDEMKNINYGRKLPYFSESKYKLSFKTWDQLGYVWKTGCKWQNEDDYNDDPGRMRHTMEGLRGNPGTAKARPIPGMFYSIWFSGRGGQTTKLVVKGEILKKASIANLSRMFPYFEVSKLQKLHTAGPYNSFDEAFLNR
jgi:hypothetical protein